MYYLCLLFVFVFFLCLSEETHAVDVALDKAEDDDEEEAEKLNQKKIQKRQENNKDKTFIVRSIGCDKVDRQGNVKYLTFWEGFDDSEATWEPEKNIADTDIFAVYTLEKKKTEEKQKQQSKKASSSAAETPKASSSDPGKEILDKPQQEQELDELDVTRRIEKHAAESIVLETAKVLQRNSDKLSATEVIENIIESQHKALAVKTTLKLNKALALMSGSSSLASAGSSLPSPDPPERLGGLEIPQLDAGIGGIIDEDNGLQCDPGLFSYEPPKPLVFVMGLGVNEDRLRKELAALELLEPPQEDDEPLSIGNIYKSTVAPVHVFDFFQFSLTKKRDMITKAPKEVQYGSMYTLYGWSDCGNKNLSPGTHMWTQSCNRLTPDGTRGTLNGWTWGQFDLCLYRGELHIILLCFHDHSFAGHTANMRLVLLKADAGMIDDEANRLRQLAASGGDVYFLSTVIHDEAAKTCTALHNEKFQPVVCNEALYNAALPFVSAYWEYLLRRQPFGTTVEVLSPTSDDDGTARAKHTPRESTGKKIDKYDPSPQPTDKPAKRKLSLKTEEKVDGGGKKEAKTDKGGMKRPKKSGKKTETNGTLKKSVDKMTVVECKNVLRPLGLPVTGTLAALRQAVTDVIERQQGGITTPMIVQARSRGNTTESSVTAVDSAVTLIKSVTKSLRDMQSTVMEQPSFYPAQQQQHFYQQQAPGAYYYGGPGMMPPQQQPPGTYYQQGPGMMPQQQPPGAYYYGGPGPGMMPQQQPPQGYYSSNYYPQAYPPRDSWRREEQGQQVQQEPGVEETGVYYV